MAGVTPGFSEPNPYPYPPKPSPLDRGGGFTPQNPRGTQGVAQGYKGTKIPQGLTQRVSNGTTSLSCIVIYHDIYVQGAKSDQPSTVGDMFPITMCDNGQCLHSGYR